MRCGIRTGITGSGKTHTMGTAAGDCAQIHEHSGMVPRTVGLIMDTLAADQVRMLTLPMPLCNRR